MLLAIWWQRGSPREDAWLTDCVVATERRRCVATRGVLGQALTFWRKRLVRSVAEGSATGNRFIDGASRDWSMSVVDLRVVTGNGEVAERSNATDCKSVALAASEVRILPSPPNLHPTLECDKHR